NRAAPQESRRTRPRRAARGGGGREGRKAAPRAVGPRRPNGRGAWHQCDGAHDRLLALDHRTDAGAWPHPRRGREDARPRDARGPLPHRAAPARHRDPTGGVALEDATTSGRGGRYVRSAAGNAEVTETRSV